MTITKPQTNKEVGWEFWNYVFNLEKQWQNSSQGYTNKELLEIFPEAKRVIPEKIEEWEQERNELLDIIEKKLTFIKYEIKDGFSQWFWREWVKVNEVEELLEIEKNIARLKRLRTMTKKQKPKSRITEEELEQARYTPIENIVNQHLKLYKSGKALVGLCPFHQEKHPSFYVYPETNSFWCYGCKQGGDVINFMRLFYNFSFKEAVKYLTGR